MTPPGVAYCRICGRAFARASMGRRPTFCSRNCRELAAFARKYYSGPVAQGSHGRVRQPVAQLPASRV